MIGFATRLPAALSVRRAVRRMTDSDRKTTVIIEGFSLNPGDCKALVGPSGSGKSTALEMLALGEAPTEADEFILGIGREKVDLGEHFSNNRQESLAAIRRKFFGYTVQQNLLMPFLSVFENIRLCQGLNGEIDEARIFAISERLEIVSLFRSRPDHLSVGQRQRVAIARALAHRPAFVLLDEPTSALDPELSEKVLALVAELVETDSAAALLVTHERKAAEKAGFKPVRMQMRRQGIEMTTRFGGR